MEAWERAARDFLASWPGRRQVTGAVLCGSFVTGRPGPRSDVDLVLVLKRETSWRERGNRVVDGFLVEYFANPPRTLRGYMNSDHATNRQITAWMLVSGRVLFDDAGDIASLAREARRWVRRPMPRLSKPEIEALQYALWDTVDNVLDAAARDAPELPFLYHNGLHALYAGYARFLRQPVLQADRIGRAYGGRAGSPLPYGLEPFPDADFLRALLRAQREREPSRMARRLERVARIALDGMGGFEIDGWRLRTPAS